MGQSGLVLLLLYINEISHGLPYSSNAWLLEIETPKEIRKEILKIIPKEYFCPVLDRYQIKIPRVDLTPFLARLHEPRRSIMEFARVELGPGSIKSDLVTYPPNYLKDKLKVLLSVNKKNEEKKKDLNAEK